MFPILISSLPLLIIILSLLSFLLSLTYLYPPPPASFSQPPPLIRRVGVVGKKKQGEERIYLNPFKDIGLLDSPIDNPHAKRVRLGVLFGVSRF